MTLGAMQPYLFPYLGYYQLMNYVDVYLFCGGLQYINRGWVNRNQIVINHKKQEVHYFTFSVKKDNYKKNINQRRYSNLKKDCDYLKRILFQNYRRASNFEEAYSVIEEALSFKDDNVADFNVNANSVIAKYLGIKSQIINTDTIQDERFWMDFDRSDYEKRVIHLCKYFKAGGYINAIGGMSLYHTRIFSDNNIELGFLKMNDNIIYLQHGAKFVPNLSIIDVIMNNKINETRKLLERYQIVKA